MSETRQQGDDEDRSNRGLAPRSESQGPNPYEAPRGTLPEAAQQPDRPGKPSLPERFLQVAMWLCSGWCGFVLAAATWEVVTMPTDAYGMHTAAFRISYIAAGATASLLALACVIAAMRVRRRQRFGRIMALCVLAVMLMVYVLNTG